MSPSHLLRPRLNGIRSNWYGALGLRGAMSCLIGQPLTREAFQGQISALLIVDAQLDAGVMPDREFSKNDRRLDHAAKIWEAIAERGSPLVA